MKRIALLFLLLATPAYADVDNPLLFSQEDGSAITVPYQVKVDHTDNGDGTITIPSGGGTPGGSNTQVQYNDSGSFAGAPNLTYTVTTNTVNTGTLNADGSAVFNESGADKDFRVEGDLDAYMIFGDASTGRVGVGASSPAYKLDIDGSIGLSNNNGLIGRSSGGVIANLASVTDTNYMFIATTELSSFNGWKLGGGPSIDASGAGLMNILATTLKIYATSGIVVNEDGVDSDFRIESDTEPNMFVIDAGTDKILIGNSTTEISKTGTITSDLGTTDRNVQSRLLTFPVTTTIAAATTTTGQNCAGDFSYQVDPYLNNFKVTAVTAQVTTASSSGTLTMNIRNRTDATNILSTALTIDVNERSSTTAATPAVINPATALISTNDDLCVQVSDAATGNSGLQVSVEVIP